MGKFGEVFKMRRLTITEKVTCTAEFIRNIHPLCSVSTSTDGYGTQIHFQNLSQGLKKTINSDCITLFDNYFDIAAIDGAYPMEGLGIRFYWPTRKAFYPVGFFVIPEEGIFRFSINDKHNLFWDHKTKRFSIEIADSIIYIQEYNKSDAALASGLNSFVNAMAKQHRNIYLER